MNITCRTLQDTSFSNLLFAFNTAFKNYFVEIQLTPDQLASKFKADGVRLDLSVGAFEGDQLVGFIFHGTDEATENINAYNAGTGVIPDYRGLHLPSKMYEFILPVLKNAGVKKIALEVIEANVKAKNIYAAIGFHVQREVNCYKGGFKKGKEVHQHVVNSGPLQYNKKQVEDFWDFTPTWQNTHLAAERQAESIICLTVEKEGSLVGYLLINKASGRILQFAVDKRFRNQEIASALFQKAVEIKETLVIINSDDKSLTTMDFLKKHGFEHTVSQYEMNKSL